MERMMTAREIIDLGAQQPGFITDLVHRRMQECAKDPKYVDELLETSQWLKNLHSKKENK